MKSPLWWLFWLSATCMTGLLLVSCVGSETRSNGETDAIHLHPTALVGEWGRRIPARALSSPSEPYRSMISEFHASGTIEMVFSEHPQGDLTPDSVWERTILTSVGSWYVLSPLNENVKLCVEFGSDPPDCWNYSVEREIRNEVLFETLNLTIPGRGTEQWMRSVDRTRTR